MTDRFRYLLATISSRLEPGNLDTLVMTCNIPEGRRAEMKDGISLFENLMQGDVISETKLGKLKELLNSLKRRDLVRLVSEYQRQSGQFSSTESDFSEIVATPSTHFPAVSEVRENQITHQQTTTPCCYCCGTVNCCVLTETPCYKIPAFYVFLSLFFVIAIISCSLFWFADVPKISEHLGADKDRKNAGKYVIIVLGLAFVIVFVVVFYGRKFCRKHRGEHRGAHAAVLSTPIRNVPENTSEAINMDMAERGQSSQDNAGFATEEERDNNSAADVGIFSIPEDQEPIC